MAASYSGGCVCGKVRYLINTEPADVIACHCRQCRKMSGHVFAATAVPRDAFEITEESGLAWYQSSATSRRGFCKHCDSSLFFDHGKNEPMGVATGSFDHDPPMKLAAHIYTDESGCYYRFKDGVERFTGDEWRSGGWQKLRHKIDENPMR